MQCGVLFQQIRILPPRRPHGLLGHAACTSERIVGKLDRGGSGAAAKSPPTSSASTVLNRDQQMRSSALWKRLPAEHIR
jgi:hypothetical protein